MIGDNIRTLRSAIGISQEELAAAVGISTFAVQFYEENKWRPGTETITRLADALKVAVTELVDGCRAVYDEKGEMLLVQKDCGCQIKVIGTFKKAN